ncbi:UNKNOWN [Stylonychia lemnae]|uniref:Uncharacterized protein n=1 Tax=Stylonychia lemnae TaxID=5949 RepID=A0A078A5S2_STYLE|nr:UNKNOWN [Stylonychia lemnae]|eukprot:CDW77256.1 UNKNOWN [Stylonychia lemnae]
MLTILYITSVILRDIMCPIMTDEIMSEEPSPIFEVAREKQVSESINDDESASNQLQNKLMDPNQNNQSTQNGLVIDEDFISMLLQENFQIYCNQDNDNDNNAGLESLQQPESLMNPSEYQFGYSPLSVSFKSLCTKESALKL